MEKGLLKFSHVYSSAPWGGKMVGRHFVRTDVPKVCSESWEISGHRYGMSAVVGGPYAGRTLDDLVKAYGRELVGTKSPTVDRFPLLFKLIDARWPLSIQVHPNNGNAALTGGEPKTEAWYVIKAFPGAALYAGLKHPFEEQDLRDIVAQGPILLDQLNPLQVTAGDMLYIPGGMPHAIGGGCFIYEVQQSSDTTFRLYDWGRVGLDGRPRTLHVREALAAMDLSLPPPVPSDRVTCPYFEFEKVPSGTEVRAGQGWCAVYVPVTGESRLLSAGENFAAPAETFVTRIP